MSATGGQEGDWLRVESLDELHRGCAVHLTLCGWCNGGSHLGTVLSEPFEAKGLHPNGALSTSFAVETTISCGAPPCVGIDESDIEQGRVFRLRPDSPSVSETALALRVRRLAEARR